MSDDQAPIGTLTAFGGLFAGNVVGLNQAGWLPCDGSSYQAGATSGYHALFNVIGYSFGGANGVFNVPDLRGRFMRGFDQGRGQDPDAASRTVSATGGVSGDAVGSIQNWATGRPEASFAAAAGGSHTHDVPNVPSGANDTAAAASTARDICANNSDTSTSDTQGSHTHTMSTGGDDETRPANINLEWFIKYDNTPA